MVTSAPQLPVKTYNFFSASVKIGADGKEYRPDVTSLRLDEALMLQRLVVESGATKTLEIGLALGASAIAVAEALDLTGLEGHHVALDPFQRAFGNVGLIELERLGLNKRVEYLSEYSEDFLHESAKCGRRFDLIFNDGAHSIGNKMTDTFFADRCLSAGGILAFHDAFMPSTAACVRYLVQERAYEPIPLPPESRFKRWARIIKYSLVHGRWYASKIIPCTHRSLVALRKTHHSINDE